jgi:hypothetical protein
MRSLRGGVGLLLFVLLGLFIIVPAAAATPVPAAYPFRYEAQDNTFNYSVSVKIYALFKCRSGASDCGLNDWEKTSTSFCLEPSRTKNGVANGEKKLGSLILRQRPVKATWEFAVHQGSNCAGSAFTFLRRTVDVSPSAIARAEITDDAKRDRTLNIPAFVLLTR